MLLWVKRIFVDENLQEISLGFFFVSWCDSLRLFMKWPTPTHILQVTICFKYCTSTVLDTFHHVCSSDWYPFDCGFFNCGLKELSSGPPWSSFSMPHGRSRMDAYSWPFVTGASNQFIVEWGQHYFRMLQHGRHHDGGCHALEFHCPRFPHALDCSQWSLDLYFRPRVSTIRAQISGLSLSDSSSRIKCQWTDVDR